MLSAVTMIGVLANAHFCPYRLDACLLGLAKDPLPPGVKKLKNSDWLYRVRVSDYRIVYRIEQKILTVLIVRIGHRREIYR